MDTSVVVAIGLGAPAAVISYLSFRAATQANKSQAEAAKVAVDSEAFERARKIYQDAIETLTEQVTQFRAQVKQMDTEMTKLQIRSRELEREVESLHVSNRELERELAALRGS